MIYQIIGIIVMLVFYGCYFMKMDEQKKKGIRTDQIAKGKKGREFMIELIMKITTITVPVVEFASIAVSGSLTSGWIRMLGIPAAVIGDAVFVVSVLTMKDSWRAGVPKEDRTELVTEGIYGYSRNPAFLGFDLVYIGIALMFANAPLIAVSIAAMVMFHLQIAYVEEPFLLRAFGEEYAEYMKHVNRYIGRRG